MSSSYRQILRSSSIIGGASVINVLIGLIRIKVAALVLGPVGIGLIGLFQSLMSTASTVASLGFEAAGTRQVAEASGRDDLAAVMAARRALVWGTLGLAVIGGALFWALREILAEQVLGDSKLAGTIGWLGIGVSLTVAAGSQLALLNGMRRIGDIARVNVLAAILATVLGIGALLLWGERGVAAFVIAAPLGSFLLGHIYVSRLPKPQQLTTPLPQIVDQWYALTKLGSAFMIAGLVTAGGQLAVRALVQRELGAEALGNFQAAWAISMTYIGFVLQSMSKDYYPRLTAAIHDHADANRIVNEQTEVALLLSGPMFLAVLGLGPLLVELMYSSQFGDAVEVLRWQILGDILKVACWPMGFIILASGDGRTFMLTETLAIGAFVGISWIALPLLGVSAAGIAFLAMYVVLLPVIYWMVRHRTGFRWNTGIFRHLAMLLLAAVIVSILADWSTLVGIGIGVVTAAAFGIFGLRRLAKMANLEGPLSQLAARISTLIHTGRHPD